MPDSNTKKHGLYILTYKIHLHKGSVDMASTGTGSIIIFLSIKMEKKIHCTKLNNIWCRYQSNQSQAYIVVIYAPQEKKAMICSIIKDDKMHCYACITFKIYLAF